MQCPLRGFRSRVVILTRFVDRINPSLDGAVEVVLLLVRIPRSVHGICEVRWSGVLVGNDVVRLPLLVKIGLRVAAKHGREGKNHLDEDAKGEEQTRQADEGHTNGDEARHDDDDGGDDDGGDDDKKDEDEDCPKIAERQEKEDQLLKRKVSALSALRPRLKWSTVGCRENGGPSIWPEECVFQFDSMQHTTL